MVKPTAPIPRRSTSVSGGAWPGLNGFKYVSRRIPYPRPIRGTRYDPSQLPPDMAHQHFQRIHGTITAPPSQLFGVYVIPRIITRSFGQLTPSPLQTSHYHHITHHLPITSVVPLTRQQTPPFVHSFCCPGARALCSTQNDPALTKLTRMPTLIRSMQPAAAASRAVRQHRPVCAHSAHV